MGGNIIIVDLVHNDQGGIRYGSDKDIFFHDETTGQKMHPAYVLFDRLDKIQQDLNGKGLCFVLSCCNKIQKKIFTDIIKWLCDTKLTDNQFRVRIFNTIDWTQANAIPASWSYMCTNERFQEIRNIVQKSKIIFTQFTKEPIITFIDNFSVKNRNFVKDKNGNDKYDKYLKTQI
jgi:hypothetical protein